MEVAFQFFLVQWDILETNTVAKQLVCKLTELKPLSYIINWREGSGQRVKPKTWRISAKSDAIWPSSPMVFPAVQPRSREKNKVQLPPSF